MSIPPRLKALGGAFAIAAALLTGPVAGAASATPTAPAASAVSVSSVGSVCYSALPSQAHDTLRLIDQGGPFPYSQDGVVFQNREGVLAQQSSGYYHEYTVITPGAPTRGTRRIITGEKSQEDYYTADHYATFRLVNFGC
ncbi:Guanyl-specific ribonuclease Sa3 [Streptomyces hundungensis]|uniref:Guanyl-specific ribonuclease Sa3 n=1 Tax=Streptomyces hundungensis TaxID=1077946 RepID=A0A387HQH3_9ACTN|nr:ribonuclease domain-containing protein [Streptomyces hundungensis]AYG83522.1 Guanyl-specific ribonuclease Sa3 [Streptomyces hundungensis]